MSNIKVFIQARFGSTRLPGKVLLKFSNNISLLGMLIKQLSFSKYLDKTDFVVLTSDTPADDCVAEETERNGVEVFRGDEENVFKRFYDAYTKCKPDYIIRICADNPFIQYQFMDMLVDKINDSNNYDYISFQTEEGIPSILTHYGFFGEVIKSTALEKAQKLIQEPKEYLHVTPLFYKEGTVFSSTFLSIPEEIETKNYRFTIDTQKDFDIAENIIVGLNQEYYSYSDLLNYIDNNDTLKNTMRQTILNNPK